MASFLFFSEDPRDSYSKHVLNMVENTPVSRNLNYVRVDGKKSDQLPKDLKHIPTLICEGRIYHDQPLIDFLMLNQYPDLPHSFDTPGVAPGTVPDNRLPGGRILSEQTGKKYDSGGTENRIIIQKTPRRTNPYDDDVVDDEEGYFEPDRNEPVGAPEPAEPQPHANMDGGDKSKGEGGSGMFSLTDIHKSLAKGSRLGARADGKKIIQESGKEAVKQTISVTDYEEMRKMQDKKNKK